MLCLGIPSGLDAAGVPLADAAAKGDLVAVRALLTKGADVNATQVDGTTPLHAAVANDHLDVADALLKAGAKAATEHLLSLGHRRIGAITGPHGWVASVDRLAGYRVSLAAAGLSADPELIAKGNFTNESGYAGAVELLSLRKPPTAIFAFNDEMAVGAMRAAEERGLQIPRDLSIVGFDDVEKTQIVTPSLTTVRQPLAEMGRMAVSLLMRILDGQRLEALHIELKTRLIVRQSTARVPEAQ